MVDNAAVAVAGAVNVLRGNISSFFGKDEYSDLLVRCGDRTWKVHRIIVCSGSPFFTKACDGRFKEAKDGCVELQDDDPGIVDGMLHFLYRSNYDNITFGRDPPATLHLRMACIADKYIIPPLAELATAMVVKTAKLHWDTEDFADVLSEVYAITDSDVQLRQALLDVVMSHAKELFDAKNEKHEHFREVASRTPVATTVIQRLLEPQVDKQTKDNRPSTYNCPNDACDATFQSLMFAGDRKDFWCSYCKTWWQRTFDQWQAYRVN